MEYTKPVIVAQNNKNGSFAAGCPANEGCNGGNAIDFSRNIGGEFQGKCRNCERTV